jgi:hypothetical protein
MRQGQHKNRSRSRGRRPSSPLSRVFESNGPDVKVRGTAQQIADKYLQLARDAQSSGDTVMAENYHQHAEHYLRILAAANSYAQQNSGYQQGQPQFHNRRPGMDDDALDEADEGPTGEDEQPGAAPATATRAAPGQDEPRHEVSPESSSEEEQDIDKPWGGPQPEFLRRGTGGNGSGRSRRPRPVRGGQSEAEQSSSSQSTSTESDQPVQPVGE